MSDSEEEIFKDIEGFPGYEVSNIGRVKCYNQYCRKFIGYWYPAVNYIKGYANVSLRTDDGYLITPIHRLVAKAFIPNPDNKQQVDHINRVRSDNRVENLRWATHHENAKNHELYKSNKSGCTGVHFLNISQRWHAEISVKYCLINLGYYDTLEDAIYAREKAEQVVSKNESIFKDKTRKEIQSLLRSWNM